MNLHSPVYVWKFFWSWLALLTERVWSSFWPAASVAFTYAALALMNIPEAFGGKGHLALLAVFIGLFIFTAKKTGKPFLRVKKEDVERRMEKEGGVSHRPLETLQDKLCQGSPVLWEAHLRKRTSALKALRVYKPRPDAAKQDRYGLRTAALLLLVIGLFVAGDSAPLRLKEAILPDISTLIPVRPVALDVWITPPDYTKAPTVFLATAQLGTQPTEGALNVPQGSILKVRVSGYARPPALTYAGVEIPFVKAASKSYTLEMKLDKSGEIEIKRWWFRSLGKWPIYITPDTPPQIDFLMTEKTPRAALKLSYSTSDDYGVQSITATFTPLPELEEKIGTKTYTFSIPVSVSEKEVQTHVEDLASHILAGNTAMMTLAATDNAGNVTVTQEKSVLLPEREFTNPAAKRVILERKRLLWFSDKITHRIAINNLADIANHPQYYKGDMVVFMALVTAVKRLIYDGDAESVASIQALLWDVALKIEDGGLSMAARELSDALQKLSEALNDPDTPDEKLQELSENVQRKMMEYMQALANEMQQRMAEGKKTPEMSPELAEKFMQHIDMGELMKQLQDMAKGNSREQMQKMAEFMKNAIDNLDMKKMDEMQESQQKAMEALQKMQDLVERQQKLMDQTGKKKEGEQCQNEAKEQQEIRDGLGQVMRDMAEFMPDLPEGLAKADQAMREAQKMLSDNKGKESLQLQKQALDELQKGMDQSIAQMAQQMKQMILSFGMMPGQKNNFGEGYDPLGREDGKSQSSDKILIPDEAERRRVQQIIKELRDRSNDFERPKVEREYIERLLEMFY